MNSFPLKRAGERLDYTIEVDDLLIPGQQIASAEVEIVGASNAESPIALEFVNSPNAVISSSGQTSPALNDRITVDLLGGTEGVTYYFKFTFTDNSSGVAKRGVRFTSLEVVGNPAGLVIPETGTGVADANSFSTLAEADAHAAARGDNVWLQADFWERERALVKAADYMEQQYRLRWRGSRAVSTQKLSWPRRGVPVPDFFDPFYRNTDVPFTFRDTLFVAINVVPAIVKEAQFYLARETLTDAGVSSEDLAPALGRTTKREKLGELEVEYFGEGQQSRLTTIFWNAERILEPLLESSLVGTALRG